MQFMVEHHVLKPQYQREEGGLHLTGDVAQWYSTLSSCVSLWVQSPAQNG